MDLSLPEAEAAQLVRRACTGPGFFYSGLHIVTHAAIGLYRCPLDRPSCSPPPWGVRGADHRDVPPNKEPVFNPSGREEEAAG